MRQTVKGIKKRLDELDNAKGETFTILFERTVSDNLQGIGVVTSLKRITISPSGTTSETLIGDTEKVVNPDNGRIDQKRTSKTQGDKDNAE